MGTVSVLLDVLALVQAGFELKGIVDHVQAMVAGGATEDDVALYLKDARDKALATLDHALV